MTRDDDSGVHYARRWQGATDVEVGSTGDVVYSFACDNHGDGHAEVVVGKVSTSCVEFLKLN